MIIIITIPTGNITANRLNSRSDDDMNLRSPAIKAEISRSQRLDSVQIMRAVASLCVLLAHIFHELPHFSQAPWVAILKSLPLGAGVDLFFIVSGFIMMNYAGRDFGRPGAAAVFILRRMARIIPPYWFFTTLMIVAIFTFGNELDSAIFTPSHAFLSYLFIPHVTPGTPSDIFPILQLGWTLIYEMFFYLVFSVALLLPRHRGLIFLPAIFLFLFVTARIGVWGAALDRFWGDSVMLEFLLGILLALQIQKRGYNVQTVAILGIFAVGSILLAVMSGLFATERLFYAGFPAFLVFLALYGLRPGRNGALLSLVLIGDASYTLYLSHPFSLQVAENLVAALAFPAGWISSIFYIGISMMLATGAGVCFYKIAEYPVTHWLAGRIPLRPAPAPIRQAS